jgi:hypothetical protein
MQSVEPDVKRYLDLAQHRGFHVVERDIEMGDGLDKHAAG